MPLQRRQLMFGLGAAVAAPTVWAQAAAQVKLPATPAAATGGASTALQAALPEGLPLAQVLGAQTDLSPYLVSEKYDGVRALWDGKTLRFRSGRRVIAPASFTSHLPAHALDGELWMARGQFDRVSGIVRKETPLDDEWSRVRYMVFELPDGGGRFDERTAQLEALVKHAAWPQLEAIAQARGADRKALQHRLDQVVAKGGEGLMLRLASAPYATGRSDALLKFKPELDAEATVVGYRDGKGKFEGRVGALEVETAQGQRFFIGTGLSDEQRARPPAVGTRITYRYRDLTPNGLPRFASFLRVHDGL
jgi:DNA ligase 1